MAAASGSRRRGRAPRSPLRRASRARSPPTRWPEMDGPTAGCCAPKDARIRSRERHTASRMTTRGRIRTVKRRCVRVPSMNSFDYKTRLHRTLETIAGQRPDGLFPLDGELFAARDLVFGAGRAQKSSRQVKNSAAHSPCRSANAAAQAGNAAGRKDGGEGQEDRKQCRRHAAERQAPPARIGGTRMTHDIERPGDADTPGDRPEHQQRETRGKGIQSVERARQSRPRPALRPPAMQ